MEMASKDPRIDAYITKAKPFARPILKHLRAVVHEACPEVEETIKWGVPHFQYRGGMMCAMASFKAHCAFGFWRSTQVVGGSSRNAEAMGDFGRITSVDELPAKSRIKSLVKAAMKLNEAGAKRVPRKRSAPKKPAAVPRDLTLALDGDAKARATFDGFPPSQQREYVEWITEAKAAATRERRIATAIEWLAEGKRRNWKYES
jgi:uncharacterized protein YdeI (YjbR/CyaY-like superfamily)